MKRKWLCVFSISGMLIMLLACELSLGESGEIEIDELDKQLTLHASQITKENEQISDAHEEQAELAVQPAAPVPTAHNAQAPQKPQQSSNQNQNCNWQLIDTEEAVGVSDKNIMSASINANTINTSYRSPAGQSCGALDFTTYHTWTEPFSILTPGENMTFSVEASWQLNGSPSCSSLAAGLNTWIAAGLTTIKTERNKVIVSIEPSGAISNSGSWTIPSGSTEGERMSIRAHGEQGGVGGTVYYKYQFLCAAPTAENENKAGGICFPQISNISNLTPGDILSPSVEFVDENGAPVGIIGHAWFINKVQTSSVVWDGKETYLELQYTCLDHSGHSKTLTIPPYGDMAAVDQEKNNQQESQGSTDISGAPQQGLPTAVAVAGLAIGLAGAGVSGGSLIISVLNATKNVPTNTGKQPSSIVTDSLPKTDNGDKKETQTGKKRERKNLLDSEKEAIEAYKKALDKMSGNVGDIIEQIEKSPLLSPESKKRLIDKLKGFKKTIDGVSKKAGSITEKLKSLQGIRDEIKLLGERYQQIQKIHMEAFKELEDLPEGAAHQLADLTTAIESFGILANDSLKRIPYFNKIYSDEYFEVTNSFKQFSQGVRRTFSRTIFRTSVEAKKAFTIQERKDFGEKGLDYQDNPEIQKALQEVERLRAERKAETSKKSIWKRMSEFLFGL